MAAREEGERVASEMMLLAGRGIQISPGAALLTCVNMAWAQVQFYGDQIAKLELEQAKVRPRREKTASLGENSGYAIEDLQLEERLNLWISERQHAIERLAKYSKMALDAGVAQQQVDLARGQGKQLGMTLQRILGALELSPTQMRLVPGLVRRELEGMTIEHTG